MSDANTIQLRDLNCDGGSKMTGETISTHAIARALSIDNFALLLDQFLNLSGKGMVEGREVGLRLRASHRTIQRLTIAFTLGVISGLAEQEFFDERNQAAIQTAQKIVQLMKSDELPLGIYL